MEKRKLIVDVNSNIKKLIINQKFILLRKMNMKERTKNIITTMLVIVIVLLISGYLVLAWELRTTQKVVADFQWAIDSIKSLDTQISSNSAEYEIIEEKKKNLTERQWELHELNKSLRAERENAQTQFLSGLWLLQSSQAQ